MEDPGENYSERRATIVRSREVTAESRVACVRHVSVPETKPDPTWIMIPISKIIAKNIEKVIIEVRIGEELYLHEVDREEIGEELLESNLI